MPKTPCMSDGSPVGQKLRATRETSLTQFSCCSFQIRFLFIASLVDRTWKAAPELRRSSIGPQTFSFFLFRSLEPNRIALDRCGLALGGERNALLRRNIIRRLFPRDSCMKPSSFCTFAMSNYYYDRYVVACLYICISERKRKCICVTNAGRGRTFINFNYKNRRGEVPSEGGV
jgi:hypothetical protein